MGYTGRKTGWFVASCLLSTERRPSMNVDFLERNSRSYQFSAMSNGEALRKAAALLKRFAKTKTRRKEEKCLR